MHKKTSKLFSIIVILAMMSAFTIASATAAPLRAISLTGGAYTQDFDTLSNTAGSTTNNLTIADWYMTESGGGARDNEQYAVDTGGSNTGDTYSYGAAGSTDRAFGALQSGTLIPLYGALFTNNTGATITSLDISYTGEQWRLGTAARTDQIDFQLSIDATSLTTGAWTDYNNLDFVTPNTVTTGAKDGNAAGNRTAISYTITGLNITNGSSFWIRWTDFNASGADDGLAVDNFSITPGGTTVQPALSINDVTQNEGDSGTTTFSFTVSLSAAAPTGGVTFDIATADNSATVADNDYVSRSLTSQTIAAGNETYTFDVTVNGDTTVETNETFNVNVTNDVGATLLDAIGLGTITNDDISPTPDLSIDDVTQNEGDSATTTFSFTVSLSAPAPTGGVTFDIATADNSATVANNDYVSSALTSQFIAGGVSIYTFNVTVNGDTTVEANETFYVNVTNVTGANVSDGQGLGTITNDDVAITYIHDIQGSGASSNPGTFTVDAIVVGDYQTQGSGQLRGFFIQEEDADADADPATSEGIFVFCSSCPTPVSVGDKVRVTGASSEYFLMSQLNATSLASVSVLSSGNPLPTPAILVLPVPGVPADDLTAATTAINAYYETFEGMLVTFPATLSVSEYFELARYGQVILAAGGRPRTFTDANIPTVSGYINNQIDLASRIVILDDTDNRQNRPVDSPNTAYYYPVPGLSISNFFRGGDTITGLTGVLHWSFAGLTGTDAWRIRPVIEKYSYAFTSVNTRPTVPSVNGSLKIASFNVLNYFLTIDTTNVCAPTMNQDCRGADSSQELTRQRTKMLAALSAINADVFGLMEMENTPGVEPLADIVAGLPGYGYINTGVIGTDAIRVGIIYKTSTVRPIGNFAILDSSVDPDFIDTRNRPALAQTFEQIATGERFTVVVNHLKSKGSNCGTGDDDTTTGQGNCNGTRTLAAQALADWMANDPTGSGDPDVLIIGDLNSYAKEDPIVTLENAGYTNLVKSFGGATAYGYVFDGQLGYLDHALANTSLESQVAGVAEWHINADEIPLFDYNDDVRTADESSFDAESNFLPLYEPNEFRTSDHDPILIGLNLDATPPILTVPANIMGVEATSAAGAVVNYPAVTSTDAVSPAEPSVICAPVSGSVFPLGTTTVNCQATDDAGNTGVGSFTITVVDTTDPILTVPANITISPTSWAGAVVNFIATATDIADPAPVVTCTPSSGSTFPFGVTTVNCTATDDSGNVAYGSFTITVGGTTYTLKIRSNGANDGTLRESSELSGLSDWAESTNQIIAVGDDYLKRQYLGILDFDTSGLPNNAVITSVKLQVKVMLLSKDLYTSLGDLLADVTNPYFGSLPSLQNMDFRFRALANAGTFTRATDSDQWITLRMNPANLFAINLAGHTQFRVRFALDDNNDMIKHQIGFLSGDYIVQADRPVILITYYLP